MSHRSPPALTPNPWEALRRFTPARIALGRVGISQPTDAQLAFQLAHARARDAVHEPLDAESVCREIATLGLATVRLHSAAADRPTYLRRPDLGRRLDDGSRELLLRMRAEGIDRAPGPDASAVTGACAATGAHGSGCELAIVLADGLSARAIHRHARPLLEQVLARLPRDWQLSPTAVVEQGRVAIGDQIGELMAADLVVVLIGERPGLSAPDSLGLYFTWSPRVGRTDAERNCISNVRPEGLAYALAAERLCRLLAQAHQRRLTGVALKDEAEAPPADVQADTGNFLVKDRSPACRDR